MDFFSFKIYVCHLNPRFFLYFFAIILFVSNACFTKTSNGIIKIQSLFYMRHCIKSSFYQFWVIRQIITMCLTQPETWKSHFWTDGSILFFIELPCQAIDNWYAFRHYFLGIILFYGWSVKFYFGLIEFIVFLVGRCLTKVCFQVSFSVLRNPIFSSWKNFLVNSYGSLWKAIGLFFCCHFYSMMSTI